MKVSVVIPAFNVEDTIQKVCLTVQKSKQVAEVIVIDNNSTDNTYLVASQSADKVLKCREQGLGHAMKLGISQTKSEIVIKIDGDIRNPQVRWIDLLLFALEPEMIFANGYFTSDYDEFPVGNLVAKPSLNIKFPELKYIQMPLSGQYIFRKSYFDFEKLPDNWAFDIAMLLTSHKLNTKIGQIDIGLLSDKSKKINEYSIMAYELLKYIFGDEN